MTIHFWHLYCLCFSPLCYHHLHAYLRPTMRHKRHKRPKKKPLASSSSTDQAAVSRKVTQSTISQYHTLLKQKAIVKRQVATQGTEGEDSKDLLDRLVDIDKKLEDLGGLKAYQEASRLGQAEDRGGDSSKILVGWLKDGAFAGKGKERESHEKIRCGSGWQVAPWGRANVNPQDARDWRIVSRQLRRMQLVDRQSPYRPSVKPSQSPRAGLLLAALTLRLARLLRRDKLQPRPQFCQ